MDLFYRIDKKFTKILNSMVDSGELAKIQPNGLAILVVLKRFTSYYQSKSGIYAYPSLEKIGTLAGISEKTVRRQIIRLTDLGYLKVIKTAGKRKQEYLLSEKFYAVSLRDDTEDKLLHAPYIPHKMKQIERDLEVFEQEGMIPANSPITISNIEIKNLQVNIINNMTGSQSVNIVSDLNKVIDDPNIPTWAKQRIKTTLKQKLTEASKEIETSLIGNTDDNKPK